MTEKLLVVLHLWYFHTSFPSAKLWDSWHLSGFSVSKITPSSGLILLKGRQLRSLTLCLLHGALCFSIYVSHHRKSTHLKVCTWAQSWHRQHTAAVSSWCCRWRWLEFPTTRSHLSWPTFGTGLYRPGPLQTLKIKKEENVCKWDSYFKCILKDDLLLCSFDPCSPGAAYDCGESWWDDPSLVHGNTHKLNGSAGPLGHNPWAQWSWTHQKEMQI